MKKIILASIFFLLALCNTKAQKRVDPTSEHIREAKELKKTYPDDDILKLYDNDKITFERDKKNNLVKVNQSHLEELTNLNSRSDISLYEFYDGQSEITKFKVKLRNNKDAWTTINDNSYTSNDLFHNDVRVKSAYIDFPVMAYRYRFEMTKEIKDIKYFPNIFFTSEYPALERKIQFIIPDWLEVELKEINFEGFEIIKDSNYNSTEKETIITYTIKNIKGFVDESNAPGITYLYPHILILAKSFTDSDGNNHTLFKSTQDQYNWYKTLIDAMNDDDAVLQEKVNELISSANTDEEKIKAIYYWVQDNIRYIAFEDGIAGFKPDDAHNVFTKRYGDCKGMANLTKRMLRIAGFDARLTWIGTRRIAYDYSTPSLSVDNHMICTLINNNKRIFLDGTEKYNAYGEYAHRIQGKQVLIENGSEYILDRVPETKAATNKETYTFEAKIEGDALVGKAKRTFNGESRSSWLYTYNNFKTDKKSEALKYYLNFNDKNLEVNNIQTTDLKDRDREIIINYELKQKNRVSDFDDIYIDLDYEKDFANYLFEKRKNDFLFYHKKDYTSIISLQIPEGYSVSEKPEDLSLKTKNIHADVSLKTIENKLILKKVFKFENGIIPKEEFTQWNNFIEQLKERYNTQIVLSKN